MQFSSWPPLWPYNNEKKTRSVQKEKKTGSRIKFSFIQIQTRTIRYELWVVWLENIVQKRFQCGRNHPLFADNCLSRNIDLHGWDRKESPHLINTTFNKPSPTYMPNSSDWGKKYEKWSHEMYIKPTLKFKLTINCFSCNAIQWKMVAQHKWWWRWFSSNHIWDHFERTQQWKIPLMFNFEFIRWSHMCV